jgi:hypothetical protein
MHDKPILLREVISEIGDAWFEVIIKRVLYYIHEKPASPKMFSVNHKTNFHGNRFSSLGNKMDDWPMNEYNHPYMQTISTNKAHKSAWGGTYVPIKQ